MLTLQGRVVSLESREWDFNDRRGVTHTLYVANDGAEPVAAVLPERLFKVDQNLAEQLKFGASVQVVVRPFIKVNNDRPPTLRLNASAVFVLEAAEA